MLQPADVAVESALTWFRLHFERTTSHSQARAYPYQQLQKNALARKHEEGAASLLKTEPAVASLEDSLKRLEQERGGPEEAKQRCVPIRYADGIL
jgi:hypothetical protein